MLVLRNFVLNSDPYSSKSRGDIESKVISQIILPASSSWNNRKILATLIRNAFDDSQDLKLNKTRCVNTNNSQKFLLFRSSLPSEMCLSPGPCDVCLGKGRNQPPQADLNKDFNESSLASVDSQSPSQWVARQPNKQHVLRKQITQPQKVAKHCLGLYNYINSHPFNLPAPIPVYYLSILDRSQCSMQEP